MGAHRNSADTLKAKVDAVMAEIELIQKRYVSFQSAYGTGRYNAALTALSGAIDMRNAGLIRATENLSSELAALAGGLVAKGAKRQNLHDTMKGPNSQAAAERKTKFMASPETEDHMATHEWQRAEGTAQAQTRKKPTKKPGPAKGQTRKPLNPGFVYITDKRNRTRAVREEFLGMSRSAIQKTLVGRRKAQEDEK